jgi:hypothetical protein
MVMNLTGLAVEPAKAAMGTKSPRLAVISDVPVERTRSGQLLVYRLLKPYPPSRLLIVTSPVYASGGPAVRLPHVSYRDLSYVRPRWICNRFNPFWPAIVRQLVRLRTNAALRAVEDFRPQAILSVAHDFLWLTAAAVARRLEVPFYLIVHDDWPSGITQRPDWPVLGWLEHYYRKVFGRVYRAAQEVFCVSPNMVDIYHGLYGRQGRLLYPSRGEDSPEPRVRVRRRSEAEPPVLAFCGSLHTQGAMELLRVTVDILKELGGHLDIYAPATAQSLATLGLHAPVVRAQGFLPPKQMAERLASNADMLFLPASFLPHESFTVRTLFPSKLADYTAIGLPILIWGPADSSAGRWGRENETAAVTIMDHDPTAVHDAVIRIARDADYAASLASRAVEAGSRDFDPNKARATVLEHLAQVSRPGNWSDG